MTEDPDQKKTFNAFLMEWLEPPVVVAALVLLCVFIAGYIGLGLSN